MVGPHELGHDGADQGEGEGRLDPGEDEREGLRQRELQEDLAPGGHVRPHQQHLVLRGGPEATAVLMRHGKKAMTAAITILDSMPKPKQARKMGAKTTLGITWKATM